AGRGRPRPRTTAADSPGRDGARRLRRRLRSRGPRTPARRGCPASPAQAGDPVPVARRPPVRRRPGRRPPDRPRRAGAFPLSSSCRVPSVPEVLLGRSGDAGPPVGGLRRPIVRCRNKYDRMEPIWAGQDRCVRNNFAAARRGQRCRRAGERETAVMPTGRERVREIRVPVPVLVAVLVTAAAAVWASWTEAEYYSARSVPGSWQYPIQAALGLPYAVAGGLVLRRRPRDAVGWTLLAVGLTMQLARAETAQ